MKQSTPKTITMASYARCLCFFFILALSFSLQTQARDSQLFSRFSRKPVTKETQESPALAPAPAPESDVVVEHGYGLYGKENYRYPPTTVDPVKTGRGVGEEKFVSLDEIRNQMKNGNGNGYHVSEKQGMSDTRFLENGKYYYDINQDVKDGNRYQGNGYETEKQGMSEYVEEENSYPRNNGNGYGYETKKQGISEPESHEKWNGNVYETEKQGLSDTRFLENGKYYYDINQDVKDENRYKGNRYVNDKQGMSEYVEDENSYPENRGNGNGYVTEKQGMSDTRFIENEPHHYETYPKNRGNGNGNGYVTVKQGMSDTRFLENGKYYYDINAEVAKGGNGHSNENNNENQYFETEEMNENYDKSNNHYNNNYENESFLNSKSEYENGYNENENEHYEGNNGYVTQGRRGHKYNPNEYVTQGREEYNGNAKKLPPNQYDTMEEYEKEEEYRLSHQYQP